MFNMVHFSPNSRLTALMFELSAFRQKVYDALILYFLEKKLLSFLIITYHKLLFFIRHYSLILREHISQYIHFNTFVLMLSLICSRLHLAGYLIIFCLLFIRIDFATLSMLRFYKKYPGIFDRNFPGVKTHTRGMWSSASKAMTEVASNPMIQAAAVAVGGMVVWKALDVHDTYTQAEIAAADRQTQIKIAETEQQTQIKIAEVEQTEENRRLAFSLKNSPEYSDLKEQQKHDIDAALKTGKLNN